jgi:hypothetical protein
MGPKVQAFGIFSSYFPNRLLGGLAVALATSVIVVVTSSA